MAVSGTTRDYGGLARPAGTDRKMLASNFDQFLTLLTTQLKNQNPLEPLDTNQFTQQLVQFASVEQQIKSNTRLHSLLQATKSSTATRRARASSGHEITRRRRHHAAEQRQG